MSRNTRTVCVSPSTLVFVSGNIGERPVLAPRPTIPQTICARAELLRRAVRRDAVDRLVHGSGDAPVGRPPSMGSVHPRPDHDRPVLVAASLIAHKHRRCHPDRQPVCDLVLLPQGHLAGNPILQLPPEVGRQSTETILAGEHERLEVRLLEVDSWFGPIRPSPFSGDCPNDLRLLVGHVLTVTATGRTRDLAVGAHRAAAKAATQAFGATNPSNGRALGAT